MAGFDRMAKTGNRVLDGRKLDAITQDVEGQMVTVQQDGGHTQRWVRGDVLGSGSFGVVFEETCVAGPESLRGTVRAVKELAKPKTAAGQAELGRELQILFLVSGCRAPARFTRAQGWWESLEHVYIAMDCYDLGDLSNNLRRPLPEEEVALITRQLLEAVHFLHQKQVTHRDIKPENLMVKSNATTGGWDVKLGDFGLCERHKDARRPGTLNGRGTPDYLAPEITDPATPADDNDETPEPEPSLFEQQAKADIWAIGQTAHFLLTKQLSREHPNALAAANVSPAGVQFVTGLLRTDSSTRPGVTKALGHPWIRAARS
ncbi:hypothetical protein OQA88_8381 [Cercophora sp. LCS_1]